MSETSSKPPRVLITAGPTHEPIDAVRYLGNRSSGRMGLALAEESTRRGWRTTLLLGPATLAPTDVTQIDIRRFRTAADLQALLAELWPRHDVLLMAAAVADFRPVNSLHGEKLRRTPDGLTLALEATPDLLAGLAKSTHGDQTVIGFALEPEAGLEAAARAKLVRKGVDAMVANPLETMDAKSVQAALIRRSGEIVRTPGLMPKSGFASWLLDRVAAIHAEKRARSRTGG